MTIDVSAVICTYQRYDLLPKAIESLVAQTASVDSFEIIVVDNSPDFEYSAKVSAKFAHIPNLIWIIERTPGLSNARNVGMKRAKAPVVAYMDDDAIADPKWIEVIAAAFARLPAEVGCIGGIVDPIWGIEEPDWMHPKLYDYLSVINWPGGSRELSSQEWVAGTNVAYRVAPLLDIGGFEVSLGRIGAGYSLLSNEETDVALRLAEKGISVYYVPEMRVDHLVDVRRVEQEWFRRRVAWQAVSDYLRNSKKHYEEAASYWRGVEYGMAKLPASQRTPAGLHLAQSEPEKFIIQLGIIYNMTIASLSGFHGVKTEPLE